jgi:predicted aspartyl protease
LTEQASAAYRCGMGRRDRKRNGTQIEKRVKVCGSKRCVDAVGIVDTGASITAITRSLADRIGARSSGPRRRLGNVGGTVEVQPVMVRLCMASGRCGCTSGIAASVRTGGFGGRSSVLIGQDYLSHVRAQIDTATGKIRCGMKKARRRRRR